METTPLNTMTRIRYDTLVAVKQVAARERRSVPSQLSIIVEDWMATRGLDPLTASDETAEAPRREEAQA